MKENRKNKTLLCPLCNKSISDSKEEINIHLESCSVLLKVIMFFWCIGSNQILFLFLLFFFLFIKNTKNNIYIKENNSETKSEDSLSDDSSAGRRIIKTSESNKNENTLFIGTLLN